PPNHLPSSTETYRKPQTLTPLTMVARKLFESTIHETLSWFWALLCIMAMMGVLLMGMAKSLGSSASASRLRASRWEKGKGKVTEGSNEEEPLGKKAA
ncbi:unnamed protein product, partial [Ilex paraguariensis]